MSSSSQARDGESPFHRGGYFGGLRFDRSHRRRDGNWEGDDRPLPASPVASRRQAIRRSQLRRVLPENLVESELFGHEAGAFTGLLRTGKKGQFELANGGTIFLDEIGELSVASQAKLLKVLDGKEIRPLGGTSARAARRTRYLRHLLYLPRELVAKREFREDLLYRIEVILLHVPPLRERPEEKKALLYAMLEHFNKKFGRDKVLALEAVAAFSSYEFPGNVRELKNLVERLVTTTRREEIRVEDLPPANSDPRVRPRRGRRSRCDCRGINR